MSSLFDAYPGVFLGAAFLTPFVSGAWLYHDATLRQPTKHPPALWGVLGLLCGVGAVLVWLVMRPKRAR